MNSARFRFNAVLLAAWLLVSSGFAVGAESLLHANGYAATPDRQFKLPRVLLEISGLALDGDDLYAHDDELGVVYQIDYRAGRVVKRFSLEGAVRADFEGITFAADQLFLTTSKGTLFATRVGAAESRVAFQRHEAEVPCEVEGLSSDSAGTGLLLACKNLDNERKDLVLYRWDLETKSLDPEPALRLRKKQWRRYFEDADLPVPKKLQLTALTTTPTGHYLALAGPQKLLLELTGTGKLIATLPLDERRHPQAEGLVLTRQGTLIIADEGDNKGSKRSPGLLSIYEPGP